MGEQKAKALVAGGVALFVTGLVIMALVVIPAARHTNMAMAQGDVADSAMEGGDPAAGGGAAYPGPGEGAGGFPGEAGMDMGMGAGMGGGMGGGMGVAEAPAAPVGPPVPPLEPSRTNPFSMRAGGTSVSAAAASSATVYGPDWSRLPIAEHMAFVAPEIPSAATPPAPRMSAGGGEALRITSILWDANGQAQAAYETDEGRSGVLKPGDRIEGSTVIEITRTGVTLEGRRGGGTQTLEIRSRSKKPESSSNRPGRGGNGAPRGVPAAPPA